MGHAATMWKMRNAYSIVIRKSKDEIVLRDVIVERKMSKETVKKCVRFNPDQAKYGHIPSLLSWGI
jgi:hypothetical protein